MSESVCLWFGRDPGQRHVGRFGTSAAACVREDLAVQWNQDRFLIRALIGDCSSDAACINVCLATRSQVVASGKKPVLRLLARVGNRLENYVDI